MLDSSSKKLRFTPCTSGHDTRIRWVCFVLFQAGATAGGASGRFPALLPIHVSNIPAALSPRAVNGSSKSVFERILHCSPPAPDKDLHAGKSKPSKRRKMADRSNPLVRVRGLRKYFTSRSSLIKTRSRLIRAVDGLSFEIQHGETLGLIGESGSGKSTTGRTLLHLLKPTSGSVEFDSQKLEELNSEQLRKLRRHMQMIFQDPYASLNPRLSVGRIVAEPLEIHAWGNPSQRRARACELLERVGLSSRFFDRYPPEFSGGQRQRIGIARALATNPCFIVADEPISALDVSIQAQVVNLLSDLKRDLGLTYLLIAHDLSMVHHLCDRVAVLYLGRIVEIGPCKEIFAQPRHPYTRALIDSVPVPDPEHALPDRTLSASAELPDPAHLPLRMPLSPPLSPCHRAMP